MRKRKIQAEIFEEIENIVPRYPLDLVSKEESDEKNDKSFLAFGKLAKICQFSVCDLCGSHILLEYLMLTHDIYV